MKRLLCRIFGHPFTEWHRDNCFYDYGTCQRCRDDVCPAEHYPAIVPDLKRWYRGWRWYLGNYFKPCQECGKRFHRHDDNFEHLPF